MVNNLKFRAPKINPVLALALARLTEDGFDVSFDSLTEHIANSLAAIAENNVDADPSTRNLDEHRLTLIKQTDDKFSSIYPGYLTLKEEAEGWCVPWAGFLAFDAQGLLGLRLLNPNQNQSLSAQAPCPSLLRTRQRFVSGREFMYSRQRDGLLIGHFVRLADFSNTAALPWLFNDAVALIWELLVAGYTPAGMLRALLRLLRAHPELTAPFDPIKEFVASLAVRDNDGSLVRKNLEAARKRPIWNNWAHHNTARKQSHIVSVLSARFLSWITSGVGRLGCPFSLFDVLDGLPVVYDVAEHGVYWCYSNDEHSLLMRCPLAKMPRGSGVSWRTLLALTEWVRPLYRHCSPLGCRTLLFSVALRASIIRGVRPLAAFLKELKPVRIFAKERNLDFGPELLSALEEFIAYCFPLLDRDFLQALRHHYG